MTPKIEFSSIDEGYLDLSGTLRLHGTIPAKSLAKAVIEIEEKLGITVSIGLSYNKFLSKLASDMDKPNGFSVIGEQNIKTFLANYPIQAISGVGRRLETKLKNDGIYKIFDLQRCSIQELQKRYGSIGERLFNFSNGIDSRLITPNPPAKSVSKEVTFNYDKSGLEQLKPVLWRLCDQISSSLKSNNKFGKTITIKLKTNKFRTITRSKTIKTPTQLADVIYSVAFELLIPNSNGTYRLMGVGLSTLFDNIDNVETDFLDDHDTKQEKLEKTIDQIREKVGANAIGKGRGFNPEQLVKKK